MHIATTCSPEGLNLNTSGDTKRGEQPMKRQPIRRLALAGLGLCLVAAVSFGLGNQAVFAQGRTQRETRSTAQGGVEVLTRGPVHEAFAEPVLFEGDM